MTNTAGTNNIQTGTVEYTGVAFEQDAEQAMAGDIIRALVELITNADDAYGARPGEITIDVVRTDNEPTQVIVRDVATGLTADELVKCFGVLGGQTSGFAEGALVRGLLGRGAKDTAAFGRTVFETIKDGIYAWFELDRRGNYNTTKVGIPVTTDHYERLEIPVGSNGLVVTMHVEKMGITIPGTLNLSEKLRDRVHLRQITADRTVVFRPFQNGAPQPTIRIQWPEPPQELLNDLEVPIDGYPEAAASLRISKLKSSSEGRTSSYSPHGIEIRGAKATFGNTFFGEAGPETTWLRCVLTCEYIDDLVRSYDEDDERGANQKNPFRILRRDRDGLAEDHPFTRALATAVLTVLAPILDDLKPEAATRAGGTELQSDLDRAAKVLAELIRLELERIEDDVPPGGIGPTAASPIIVIPPLIKMRPGTQRSITILIHKPSFPAGVGLVAAARPGTRLTLLALGEPLPHDFYEDTLVATGRIEAVAPGDAVVTITDSGTGLSASAEVIIGDHIIVPVEPPVELEWKNATMSVMVERTRTVRLRAPIDLAPTGRLSCTVELDGPACELIDLVVQLELTNDGWLEGTCAIKGLVAGESCGITAHGGGATAEGTVRVTRPSALTGLGTEIQIVDEAVGSWRGSMEETDSGYLIQVYGRHVGLTHLLGDLNDDGIFSNEQERHVRIALCEAVATVMSDWVVSREATKYPQDFHDVDAVIFQRNQLVRRFLLPLQRILATEETAS